MLGPICKPRVRPSIVSRPLMARELIRICGRRSDLLLWNAASVRVVVREMAWIQVSCSTAFFASIAQMIRACFAAIATQARW